MLRKEILERVIAWVIEGGLPRRKRRRSTHLAAIRSPQRSFCVSAFDGDRCSMASVEGNPFL